MSTSDISLAPVFARMREALTSPSPSTDRLYSWLRYQLGWADQSGEPVDERTGKGIRPRLALLACSASGGDVGLAVPAAAAIELTHEFSLIHDDIEDGDVMRRGRPSLWTVSGTAQAINAGDALFCVARSVIATSPVDDAVSADLQRRYDSACVRLSEGQFLDLSFEDQKRVETAAYIGMVRRKTGALLGAAASMGAVAGGCEASVADSMAAFGEALGVGFQVRDDVLGLWGDPAVTGKPVGADLMRKKKSLPVLLAWETESVAAEVDALYATEEPDEERVSRVAALMDEAGCRERAEDMARSWGEKAEQAVNEMPLCQPASGELARLVRRAVDRKR